MFQRRIKKPTQLVVSQIYVYMCTCIYVYKCIHIGITQKLNRSKINRSKINGWFNSNKLVF